MMKYTNEKSLQEAVENLKETTEQILKNAIKKAAAAQKEIDELEAEAAERENARNAREAGRSMAHRLITMPIGSRTPYLAPTISTPPQQDQ
ncbi:hypothetical protein N7513_006375 [Penicillium frequentans]|nr:hypothetical protein N7513_006375 [Penicillium glabrum]